MSDKPIGGLIDFNDLPLKKDESFASYYSNHTLLSASSTDIRIVFCRADTGLRDAEDSCAIVMADVFLSPRAATLLYQSLQTKLVEQVQIMNQYARKETPESQEKPTDST